jgi:Tfp pilus assembly protein PilX
MQNDIVDLNAESGSALILAILVLAILTILGISAVNTSTLEVQIATADMLHKEAFFAADGGTEAGIELLERCIDEKGFTNGATVDGNMLVVTGSLYLNGDIGNANPDGTNQDARFPPTGTPLTRLRIGGDAALAEGSSANMISGYEGAGRGSAAGGSWITYDIRSRYEGRRQNESVVNMGWRHLN